MRVTVVVFLSVCMYPCVCYRANGYISGLYVQSEVVYSFYRLLKVCIMWTLLKTIRLGDMALFACHDDW